MTLTSPAVEQAKAKDAKILRRVQKRLRRAFADLRTWRNVGSKYGVNHGYVSMVMHGAIPSNVQVRVKLGFPKVLPSERKPRIMKPRPPKVGEAGWEEVYLKRLGK